MMSRTVTLRLPEPTYKRFRTLAERENRPLSNFIETAASRYVEMEQFVDEFEMAEIEAHLELNRSLKRGIKDAKAGRGRFV
jgi:predicted transcriptional regulator